MRQNLFIESSDYKNHLCRISTTLYEDFPPFKTYAMIGNTKDYDFEINSSKS